MGMHRCAGGPAPRLQVLVRLVGMPQLVSLQLLQHCTRRALWCGFCHRVATQQGPPNATDRTHRQVQRACWWIDAPCRTARNRCVCSGGLTTPPRASCVQPLSDAPDKRASAVRSNSSRVMFSAGGSLYMDRSVRSFWSPVSDRWAGPSPVLAPAALPPPPPASGAKLLAPPPRAAWMACIIQRRLCAPEPACKLKVTWCTR